MTMPVPTPATSLLRPILQFAALLATMALFSSSAARAQSSGKGVELHANGQATAAEVGLPAYPGATIYKEKDSDSGALDMGLTFGDFHFRVVAASYQTGDSPAKVLDFYRKPLARYGDVLECDHGNPVGALKVARSGLTCSSSDGQHVEVNGSSSDDHELRVGTPSRFRIVAIAEPHSTQTRFGVVLVELPKDTDDKAK
jgi:hypothetical protein